GGGGVAVAEGGAGGPRRYAEGARLGDGAGVLGGRDQRFRGHAAGVEAFAPHLVLLDQHHRYAEGGRGGGDREATGARADDANVGLQTFRHAFSSRQWTNNEVRRIVDRAASRITHYPSAPTGPLPRARRGPRRKRLRHHRNERENAERHGGAEKLRRERRLHVEFEPAIGAARREAGLVGGLLRGDHAVEAGADEGKREGDGDDAERGRRHEGRERDPAQRRNEVDEPEWKDRHQA